MKQNLNLENFWNELFEKFPIGTKVFCDWIDKYKEENNWKVLFNCRYKVVELPTSIHSSPKFHDLPRALQLGILFEFIEDVDANFMFNVVDWNRNAEIIISHLIEHLNEFPDAKNFDPYE